MCIEGMIGIHGECSDAKIYIDDLPGINIQNVSDSLDGTDVRPLDLVRKCFNQAIDSVYTDWINQIKSSFDYLGIISDSEFKNAGVYSYYGLLNESIGIKIERLYRYQKFVKSHIYSFGLVSDRAVTKTFYVTDEYGATLQDLEVDLIEGYNDIAISIESSSCEINIRFSLSDFRIGRKENIYYFNNSCSPCFEIGCTDCLIMTIEKSSNNFATTTSISNIGFNLKVKCIADKCEIINYFFENLKVPLLYKTGINYLTHAKMSTRVNPYTTNSIDKINELLLMWQGGTDTITGIKTNSQYWSSLKTASDSSISTLITMKSSVFGYNSDEIVNILP